MSNSIVLFTGTMADSVRNTIEEYGVDRLEPGDVIVANDPYRNGTHVNDLLFMPAGVPRRRDRRVRQPARRTSSTWAASCPAASASRSATSTRTGSCSRRGALYRAGEPVQRDLEPDLRQRPLRRDPVSRHADDLRRARARRAAAARRRSSATALEAVHGAMRYVCDAVGRADGDRARGDPGRQLGGRGHRSTATGSTTPRSTASASRVTKRGRPRRGRLQRHVAAGAHLHQRDGCSTPRRRSGVAFKYLFDPRAPFTSGAAARRRHRDPRGDGRERAAARRRGVRLLGAEPGDDARRCCARSRRRVGAAAIGGRPRRHRHPQRARRRCRTARPGSRPPSAAARSARSAPTGTATPTRQMLSYQANGIARGGRGGRVRRAGRRAARTRSCPTRRRRLQPRRRRDDARHALAPAGASTT